MGTFWFRYILEEFVLIGNILDLFELKVQGGLPFITGLVDLKLRRLAKARHKNEEDEVCPHGGKVLELSFIVIQI